jgi:hypothetical protein
MITGQHQSNSIDHSAAVVTAAKSGLATEQGTCSNAAAAVMLLYISLSHLVLNRTQHTPCAAVALLSIQTKCPDIKKACPGNTAVRLFTKYANTAEQFKAKQGDYITGVARAASVSPAQVIITDVKLLYTPKPGQIGSKEPVEVPAPAPPAAAPAANATKASAPKAIKAAEAKPVSAYMLLWVAAPPALLCLAVPAMTQQMWQFVSHPRFALPPVSASLPHLCPEQTTPEGAAW